MQLVLVLEMVKLINLIALIYLIFNEIFVESIFNNMTALWGAFREDDSNMFEKFVTTMLSSDAIKQFLRVLSIGVFAVFTTVISGTMIYAIGYFPGSVTKIWNIAKKIISGIKSLFF